ncbi:hypothetical protein SteCoe_16882 [Stentor coeruleus]|uniref:Uncharacterized protein n=1 Tax=Stentor coeruleus TaxID=5963 RepID=A0A1R2C068_9CILI|nr:hypothetical protein SteCoe_16882 [Stentor coeruleus]
MDTRMREKIRLPIRCYFLIGIMLFVMGVGVYFLIQSQIDPQSKEFLALDTALVAWVWSYQIIKNSSVSAIISDYNTIHLDHNTSEIWGSDVENFPKYSALFYSSYEILIINNTLTEVVYMENPIEYNVTVDIKFDIEYNGTIRESKIDDVVVHSKIREPVNAKVCKMNGRGYWDIKSDSCYCHYNTIKICIVVNDSLHVVDWYKNGCDGTGYYKQEVINWINNSAYTNLSYPIYLEVRSQSDPFVFASYNNLIEFSSSSEDYKIIGGVLFGVSILTLCVPIIWIYFQKRKIKYLEFINEQQQPKNIF